MRQLKGTCSKNVHFLKHSKSFSSNQAYMPVKCKSITMCIIPPCFVKMEPQASETYSSDSIPKSLKSMKLSHNAQYKQVLWNYNIDMGPASKMLSKRKGNSIIPRLLPTLSLWVKNFLQLYKDSLLIHTCTRPYGTAPYQLRPKHF